VGERREKGKGEMRDLIMETKVWKEGQGERKREPKFLPLKTVTRKWGRHKKREDTNNLKYKTEG